MLKILDSGKNGEIYKKIQNTLSGIEPGPKDLKAAIQATRPEGIDEENRYL